MQNLLTLVTGQFNALNLVLFFLLAGLVAHKLKWNRTGRWLTITSVLIFYLVSTDYVPRYLAMRLEQHYPPLRACPEKSQLKSAPVIHVLGGGYTGDGSLPALAQLSLESKGRLAEGIRLMHCHEKSLLVCSGNRMSGAVSMAGAYQNAARSLGVDTVRMLLLHEPRSTEEEAHQLAQKVGKDHTVILVTSAIHMMRAMAYFRAAGFDPVPAPTNYLVKSGDTGRLKGWPSIDNMRIMDAVIHEYLGTLKARFF